MLNVNIVAFRPIPDPAVTEVASADVVVALENETGSSRVFSRDRMWVRPASESLESVGEDRHASVARTLVEDA